MGTIKKQKVVWRGRIEGKKIVNVVFDELTVQKAHIKRTIFKNVHFKNCQLGINSNYTDCLFVDCKFDGKNCSLGRSCSYTDCDFENSKFIGVDLFGGQNFYACKLSGLMRNSILSDNHPIVKNNATVFNNCNLTNLMFENISIYGKDVFNNCFLPLTGIKLFDNTNDRLIDRAEKICGEINNEDGIESLIVFKRELKQGQNPIILDDFFLNTFFESEDSRRLFKKIVQGYELN